MVSAFERIAERLLVSRNRHGNESLLNAPRKGRIRSVFYNFSRSSLLKKHTEINEIGPSQIEEFSLLNSIKFSHHVLRRLVMSPFLSEGSGAFHSHRPLALDVGCPQPPLIWIDWK